MCKTSSLIFSFQKIIWECTLIGIKFYIDNLQLDENLSDENLSPKQCGLFFFPQAKERKLHRVNTSRFCIQRWPPLSLFYDHISKVKAKTIATQARPSISHLHPYRSSCQKHIPSQWNPSTVFISLTCPKISSIQN